MNKVPLKSSKPAKIKGHRCVIQATQHESSRHVVTHSYTEHPTHNKTTSRSYTNYNLQLSKCFHPFVLLSPREIHIFIFTFSRMIHTYYVLLLGSLHGNDSEEEYNIKYPYTVL